MKTRPAIRVITATEAKNRFGDIIRSAKLRSEHLILKRDGIPVVAIVPIADYQRLFGAITTNSQPSSEYASEEPRERELANMSLAEFLHAIHDGIGEVDEEEAERDILEAVHEVRALKRTGKLDD